MSLISVRVQPGLRADTFAAVKADWQKLFAETTCSPFMAWEWMSTWFESFGGKKTPVILKAYRGDTLVAILPLLLASERVLGMRTCRLSFIGGGIGGADHLDIIARSGDKQAALRAIFEFLSREIECRQIWFEGLAAGSGLLGSIRNGRSSSEARFPGFSEGVTAVCPQIDLTEGWDTLLNRSRRSSNFNRRLRKLQNSHNTEFRSITQPRDVDDAFERFLGLHEQRWRASGGSELTGHPRLVDFQRRVVARLSQAGLVRFDELWVDGKCTSSVYGLDNGRTFYYFNSGYDLDYSHLSVGLVLLGLSIRSAFERGNTLYDFLRGDEEYKFDWATRTEQLFSVSLHDRSLPIITHELVRQGVAGFTRAIKPMLPVGLLETLANARRVAKRNYQMASR